MDQYTVENVSKKLVEDNMKISGNRLCITSDNKQVNMWEYNYDLPTTVYHHLSIWVQLPPSA